MTDVTVEHTSDVTPTPEAADSTPQSVSEVPPTPAPEAAPAEPVAPPITEPTSSGPSPGIAAEVSPAAEGMASYPTSNLHDDATLAPAEGGHVEPHPSADLPGAARGRSGAVGLPGSEERSRSVGEADAEGGEADDEPPAYELPRIIAIANQKGGVGKTTTSVNLGASLAELGYRVLVVDLDPQGNATTGLGINARNLQASVYDVIMTNAAIEDCVEPTSLKNLFVAPATIDLAGAEIELVPAFSRELKLRRALEEVRDEYDYVLIDCPPSLGLLTVNGLAAADDVIVPIQCEYYALEGLSQLIRNVTLVRTNLNPKLDVRGIVLTMYDARTKLADQVEQEVREHFGRRVYQTVVPRTVRLSEAPSFGQPIIVFDSTSRGAVAYRELAKEVSSGATRRAG
jgi:chromosome partitioning protein